MTSDIQPLAESDWDEPARPFELGVLPMTPDDFSQRTGLSPVEYEEEGRGRCQAFLFLIHNTRYLARAYPDGPELSQYLSVCVRSIEPESQLALDRLLDVLGLTSSAMLWCETDLGHPRWVLYRVDDNGGEFEMARFQESLSAELVRDHYERKGHKQTYFVRPLTQQV